MTECKIRRNGPLTVYFASQVEDVVHVTASVTGEDGGPAAASAAAYEQIGEFLAREDMQIVHERVFGSLSAESAVIEARRGALSRSGIPPDGPLTYIQGHPLWGRGLAGIQLCAVRSGDVWPVYHDGILCGRGWERHGARFLILQNVHGRPEDAPADVGRTVEAQQMFDRAAAILRAHGATYADVVRTWIYLSDILDWYEQFNEVRNAKYDALGLMPDLSGDGGPGPLRLPASTGIEGDSPCGAASLMDVLAMAGEARVRPEIVQLTNVKQIDAFQYGSAFSRGACIREPDVVHIQVSGTAAINEQGESMFPGDAQAQMLWTFANIEALIAQGGAVLQDICQATVFLKRPQDYAIFRKTAAERGLDEMPAVCVRADVCRDELLFEMDGVAAFPSADRS